MNSIEKKHMHERKTPPIGEKDIVTNKVKSTIENLESSFELVKCLKLFLFTVTDKISEKPSFLFLLQ